MPVCVCACAAEYGAGRNNVIGRGMVDMTTLCIVAAVVNEVVMCCHV